MSTIRLAIANLEEEDFRSDVSATLTVIRNYLPKFDPELKMDLNHGWWSFKLPNPSGADYTFSLHGEIGGERQISARPSAQTGVRPQFWYSPIEMASFRDDFSKLEVVFHERVEGLLRYPTRIFEKKGIIWLSYWAEYQSVAGWKRLGGISNLGLGLGIPFFGKKRIYTSPPVSNSNHK